MSQKFDNIIILTFFTILLIIPTLYFFQSMQKRKMYDAGYCLEKSRYATSVEVYDNAIQYLVDYRSQSKSPRIDSKYWPDSRLPKYRDVAEFRAENSKCCEVDLFKKTRSGNSVYLGDNGYAVGVHLREALDEYTPYFSTSVDLTACGEIIGASHSAENFPVTRLRLYDADIVEKYYYMPSSTFVRE